MKHSWLPAACWTLLGCPSPPPLPIPFEDARRGDEARKLEFLDRLLGKLVYDGDRNPAGCVKAWYHMPGGLHKDTGCHCGACAREALREGCRRDVREMSLENERLKISGDVREASLERRFPAILGALKSPAGRLTVYYREGAPFCRKKHEGILIAGDLFNLANEDELRSALEDFLPTYLKDREEGMLFKEGDEEYEFNPAIPILREIAHASMINLHARSVQIEKIASGTRRVSVEFRQAVVGDYLKSHQLFSKRLFWEKHILYNGDWDSGWGLQKDIVDFLETMKKHIHRNLKKVG